VGEAVEERGGHPGIAEDGGPFAEGEVGCDEDRGLLVDANKELVPFSSAATRAFVRARGAPLDLSGANARSGPDAA
jgi:hypothetical protein